MSDRKEISKLIFIYNADSGFSNALIDSVHKIVSPSTYDCKLCDITFGLFGEKAEWKEFRESFGLEMVFLHRDELNKEGIEALRGSLTYPAVLARRGEEVSTLVSSEDLNELADMSSLIDLIRNRVSDS